MGCRTWLQPIMGQSKRWWCMIGGNGSIWTSQGLHVISNLGNPPNCASGARAQPVATIRPFCCMFRSVQSTLSLHHLLIRSSEGGCCCEGKDWKLKVKELKQ
ncbi:hypothetical protein BDU57DRAFT_288232 [Ampelomyces quisqualis]|uniref:Uncharacterized protein n=1 Tax=Ampelomyces quisqualis TaxID=50730 RepID=A0A6A5QFT0_AMPQU|nr:hypothetical protein BDU57DRAFT_288232 [Ampelomyces quisqualis]